MGRNRIGCVLDLLHLSLVMLNNLGFLVAGEVAFFLGVHMKTVMM